MPGVVYGGGEEARRSRSPNASVRTVLHDGRGALRPRDRRRRAVPVVVKEQQRHPVRGNLQHIDLQEVKLDEAIEAEVAIELEGAEDAPGVKEGGVLEHVTREITVEALPTDIPERIVVDVSAMEINDTLQLSAVDRARGRHLRRRRSRGGHDRDPLAAARRGGAGARGRGGGRAGRRGGRGRPRARRCPRARSPRARASSAARALGESPARSSRAVALPPPRGGEASGDGGPHPDRRARQPRRRATPAPATTSASRSPPSCSRRWELPRAKQKFGGLIAEGRAGPGGPRVAVLLPQTYMNESGDSAGPARGSLKVPLDRRGRPPRRDRPSVRRGAGASSAAASPATTASRASSAASATPSSGGSGSGSGAPTRPTRRSSPPTCSARFREPREQVAELIAAPPRRPSAWSSGSARPADDE